MEISRRGRWQLVGILAALTISMRAAAWDPIKQLTGKNLTNIVEGRLKNFDRQARKFVKDPIRYSLELPVSTFLEHCGSPFKHYADTLPRQVRNWKYLSPGLIAALQPGYRNDLMQVRYAEGVRTSNGAHQAIGNSIYFNRSMNLHDANDMWELLHELEHTSQFAGESQASRLCEYWLQAHQALFQHDNMQWERDADRKANIMLDRAMDVVNRPARSAWPAKAAQATSNEPYPPPPPSRAILTHELRVLNRLDRTIYFELQTATHDWGVFSLPPGADHIISGTGGQDSWFNVRHRSENGVLEDSVDGGQTINWAVDPSGDINYYRFVPN
jgi:hypothetical protein